MTPSNLPKAEDGEYTMTLAISFVVVLVIPFVIYALHDKTKHRFFVRPRRLRHGEVNVWVPPQMRGEHVIRAQGEDVLGQDDPNEHERASSGAANAGAQPEAVRPSAAANR